MTLTGTSASVKHGTDMFIIADIFPSTSTEYGLVINYKTTSKGPQYLSFKYLDGVYKFCFARANSRNTDCKTFKDIPVDSQLKIRHTIIGNNHYYKGYVGDKALPTLVLDSQWGGGLQGVSATGVADFNFLVRTPATVKFTLASCSMDDDDIINLIAKNLGIKSNLVLGIQRMGCTKKRETLAEETVTAVIVGSETSTARELADQLVSNPNPSMTSVSIESSSFGDIAAESGSALKFTESNPLTESSTTSSTMILIIVGISVGVVVGIVGIIVGIVFAVKAKKNSNAKHPPPPPAKNNGPNQVNL
jgi:hypothetical protein